MESHIKEFFSKFAALMEEYKVDMEAVETTRGYQNWVSGIEFNFDSIYDVEKEVYTRNYTCIKAGVRLDFKDIKQLIENNKPE